MKIEIKNAILEVLSDDATITEFAIPPRTLFGCLTM